ncbi:rust resistance kinase Lr10-like isoform X2 [Rhodamnia argentea]|nr:rust resistance kinase Lr10-like isoform X2 [Rhodamnia argentea]
MNGMSVAIKVLNGSSDKRIEDQSLAEVTTVGRTHHMNLVQLYGFCFDRNLRALVYEFMQNSSLDRLLFGADEDIEWDVLYNIAIGTGKGITYLHEECQQMIIHYDIKPGNILLDTNFCPKVADFGLAKLCNRGQIHVTISGVRGTPGYAAPEMWMPFPITQKCDVYSFGMLLVEILGRRSNLDVNLPDSQEWFPRWVWKKHEMKRFSDVMIVCRIQEHCRDKAERMAMVALWCVQYKQASRPSMNVALKMLEGGVEIPLPANPFLHLMESPQPEVLAEVKGEACSFPLPAIRILAESSNPGTAPTI